MSTYAEQFQQIEWLYNSGISLIPVRDKPDGDRPAKTPYNGWKKYQSERADSGTLHAGLINYNTTAVAMICGKVSGNLEIIDIDVKYKPGIDTVVFMALRDLYPSLYERLRIHKTPSGGYHILYKTDSGIIPGNQKLAGRNKTDAELIINPRGKTVNFIETRGEGGYALAPPSMAYTVLQDVPIPVISWEDRCSIIQVMKVHSEIVEITYTHKPTKAENTYYDENPFDHFNNSPEAEIVMQDYGWKNKKSTNPNFLHFEKPGSKKGGTHATFNKTRKVYFIFTSDTDFDESKGYNPATVLSILAHGGDKTKTYAYLVQKGYGKIKAAREAQLIKNRATTNKPLPPNASAAAKIEYAAGVVQYQSTYPYGVFWEKDDENKMKISRERLYMVAEGLGYRFYNNTAVCINGYIVTKITERIFFDGLKAYIKETDADEYIEIADCFEAFIQKNGTFTITRLPYFNEAQLVRDTSNSAYKFYQNGYLYITGTEFTFHTYDTLSGLIWHEDILQRQYQQAPEGGKYLDFIKLATQYDTNQNHIRKCIGYLSHKYKDEMTGFIMVLPEACEDPKMGGGSGKNVFCSLFGYTTTFKTIPGEMVHYDEKFLQSWNYERIFCISDPDKRFKYSFLKEFSTGTGLLKKLFKDEIAVTPEDMPKFIIPTNFSFDNSDGPLKRRIIFIEFTDFFTKAGGVDVHFGCHFPKGWHITDWIGFDNFIAGCIKDWIGSGLKLVNPVMTEGGWIKQFEQTYGQIISGILEEYLQKWVDNNWIKSEDFRTDIEHYYRENGTPISFRPSSKRIHEAIIKYCEHNKLQFQNNILKRNEINVYVKYKWFGREGETPL